MKFYGEWFSVLRSGGRRFSMEAFPARNALDCIPSDDGSFEREYYVCIRPFDTLEPRPIEVALFGRGDNKPFAILKDDGEGRLVAQKKIPEPLEWIEREYRDGFQHFGFCTVKAYLHEGVWQAIELTPMDEVSSAMLCDEPALLTGDAPFEEIMLTSRRRYFETEFQQREKLRLAEEQTGSYYAVCDALAEAIPSLAAFAPEDVRKIFYSAVFPVLRDHDFPATDTNRFSETVVSLAVPSIVHNMTEIRRAGMASIDRAAAVAHAINVLRPEIDDFDIDLGESDMRFMRAIVGKVDAQGVEFDGGSLPVTIGEECRLAELGVLVEMKRPSLNARPARPWLGE